MIVYWFTCQCMDSDGSGQEAMSCQVLRRDVSVETGSCSVGVMTDPDCLGPCEPGTAVTLDGIVWSESMNGQYQHINAYSMFLCMTTDSSLLVYRYSSAYFGCPQPISPCIYFSVHLHYLECLDISLNKHSQCIQAITWYCIRYSMLSVWYILITLRYILWSVG